MQKREKKSVFSDLIRNKKKHKIFELVKVAIQFVQVIFPCTLLGTLLFVTGILITPFL